MTIVDRQLCHYFLLGLCDLVLTLWAFWDARNRKWFHCFTHIWISIIFNSVLLRHTVEPVICCYCRFVCWVRVPIELNFHLVLLVLLLVFFSLNGFYLFFLFSIRIIFFFRRSRQFAQCCYCYCCCYCCCRSRRC